MRFQALGGAHEVGASGYLLRVAGRNILVDCGIRVNRTGMDSLPDLRALPRKLDLVLLTHAHMDHSGALPIIRARYPLTPIITTSPTLRLIKILLADAVNIMKMNSDRAEPLYDGYMVQEVVRTIETQEFNQWFMPLSDIAVCLIPAGHILGAACVLLDTPEGKIVCSGDVSVSHQRTVPGVAPPAFSADWMVLESTYGYSTHPDRAGEERTLAETVGEIVEHGGVALIPSFALGRAQEVLLCLHQLQERGALPRFPIFADGMVRVVSDAYARHVDYLSPTLQERARRGEDIFWEKNVHKVNPRFRHLVGGEPCCIVSSSGMLTGGPSVGYAQRLLPNDQNAILITGYTDEESPGRRLQELQQGDTIRLAGEQVPVKCRVGRVNLSAHADQMQLLDLAQHFQPHEVILVHGEDAARATLGDLLYGQMRVATPLNNEVLEWAEPRWWGGWTTTGRNYRGQITYDEEQVNIELPRRVLSDKVWRERYLGYDAVQARFLGQHLVVEPTSATEEVQVEAAEHLAGDPTEVEMVELPPEVAEARELLGLETTADVGAPQLPYQSAFPCIICGAAKRYHLDCAAHEVYWQCPDCGREYSEMIKNLKQKDWERLEIKEQARLYQFAQVRLYLYEPLLPKDWKEQLDETEWEQYLDLWPAAEEEVTPAPQRKFPCLACGGAKRYELNLEQRVIRWECVDCGHSYNEMLLNLKKKELEKLDDDGYMRLLQFAAVCIHIHELVLPADWTERVEQHDWERYWEMISA